MIRIDTDNLSTQATRALAEAEEILTARIADYEERVRIDAAAMSSATLRKELDRPAPSAAKKDELVELYVKQEVAKGVYARELYDRRMEARRDLMLADAINELVDASEGADAHLRQITADNNGMAMYSKLRYVLDDAFVSHNAAVYAVRVVRAMSEGMELRDAALHILRRAMETIYELPGRVNSNGLSSVMKAEPIMEARAAGKFRDIVTRYLPGETQVSIDMLSR